MSEANHHNADLAAEEEPLPLELYQILCPFEQGYALYWLSDLPGSKIRGQHNNYTWPSQDWMDFQLGQLQAILDVMDGGV